MKSTLPMAHLLRQYFLFALTVVFLLTMMRAAYALWQFPLLEQTGAYIPLFLQGLRFDLALIGIICLIPTVIGSLLSTLGFMRPVVKFLVSVFFFGSLLLILVLELITPWFISNQGVRPDLELIKAVEAPLEVIKTLATSYPIHIGAGVFVSVLILIAYWLRMELPRFLRIRTSVFAAFGAAIICSLLCVFAIWSKPDIRQASFGPGDALISTNNTVNDIAMNTAYKTLYSVALPYFNQ